MFEAALTLPVSLPELKSWAPSSVMDSGGCAPTKKMVVVDRCRVLIVLIGSLKCNAFETGVVGYMFVVLSD